MLFKSNQKGFTLIETLFVLAIFAVVSVTAIEQMIDRTRVESGEQFGKKLTTIISTIDKRLFVEGYDAELWIDDSDNPLVDDSKHELLGFATDQLYTDNNPCVDESNWILDSDLIAEGVSYGLPSCNIFPGGKYGLTISSAEVTFTTHPYAGLRSVAQISIDFDISSVYKKYMKELTVSLSHANKLTTQSVSGFHNYYFYDKDIEENIGAPTCLTNLNTAKSCVLRAELDTASGDGTQYLKVSGANRMIGNVEFSADPDDRTSKTSLEDCYVWRYDPFIAGWSNFDPTQNYDATTLNTVQISVPCGLRYDSASDGTDEKKVLNIAANTITASDSISVSKECDVTEFTQPTTPVGDEPYKRSDAFQTSSYFGCGIFKDINGSNLVIALVDDVYASTVNAKIVNTEKINAVDIYANFADLVTSDIGTANVTTLNTALIYGTGAINTELLLSSDKIEIKATNGITLSGVVDVGKNEVITGKAIDEFTNQQEFVSKDYIDQFTEKYVAYVNNNHLNGDIILRNPVSFTGATNVLCKDLTIEKPVVSPVQTHSTPVVLTYAVEKVPQGYRVVVIDGNGIEDITAKVNVVVFCEK